MKRVTVASTGYNSTYDITEQVAEALRGAHAGDGLYGVFAHGSTLALTVMRHEPGAVEDLFRALNRVSPDNERYVHELTTKDPNGFAHIRSSLLGTSLLVPWVSGALAMSEKHRVVLVDFDLIAADRHVYIDTREEDR